MAATTETRAAPHVGLARDWALWRDFAVRSTGFGIAGLGVFGAPDEEERLAQVARDPRFREAVMRKLGMWTNIVSNPGA
jgi:hypothetical protein